MMSLYVQKYNDPQENFSMRQTGFSAKPRTLSLRISSGLAGGASEERSGRERQESLQEPIEALTFHYGGAFNH